MNRRQFTALPLAGALRGAPKGRFAITSFADVPATVEDEAVLFAFDDRSWPLVRGGRIVLEKPEKRSAPVVPHGKSGDPDELAAHLEGTVLRDGGKFRMWYTGFAPTNRDFPQPSGSGLLTVVNSLYAESEEGLRWTKPKLGLVKFSGSRDNNITLTHGLGCWWPLVMKVDDAPASERYRVVVESLPDKFAWAGSRNGIQSFFVSPDGIRWKPAVDVKQRLPVPYSFEQAAFYRFQGFDHLCGHEYYPSLPRVEGSAPSRSVRILTATRTNDFRRWPDGSTRSVFFPTAQGNTGRTWSGQECHMGVSVIPRGNVCIGMFGIWLDRYAGRERHEDEVQVDLGFAISNDGLHFREAAPGHVFMGYDKEAEWTPELRKKPNEGRWLIQGQSIVNWGEQTLLYYSAAHNLGNVDLGIADIGLATMPRDRFGRLELIPKFDDVRAFSCPMEATAPATLALNLTGATNENPISAAIWDERRTAIVPGFSHDACIPVTGNSLRAAVRWKERQSLPVRERFVIELRYREPVRFYAAYLAGVA